MWSTTTISLKSVYKYLPPKHSVKGKQQYIENHSSYILHEVSSFFSVFSAIVKALVHSISEASDTYYGFLSTELFSIMVPPHSLASPNLVFVLSTLIPTALDFTLCVVNYLSQRVGSCVKFLLDSLAPPELECKYSSSNERVSQAAWWDASKYIIVIQFTRRRSSLIDSKASKYIRAVWT